MYPKPVNFQRVIRRLRRSGWNQSEIAREIGCSQASISRLENNRKSEPQHHLGEKLLWLQDQVSE